LLQLDKIVAFSLKNLFMCFHQELLSHTLDCHGPVVSR
jgi:hypothetical protein